MTISYETIYRDLLLEDYNDTNLNSFYRPRGIELLPEIRPKKDDLNRTPDTIKTNRKRLNRRHFALTNKDWYCWLED